MSALTRVKDRIENKSYPSYLPPPDENMEEDGSIYCSCCLMLLGDSWNGSPNYSYCYCEHEPGEYCDDE